MLEQTKQKDNNFYFETLKRIQGELTDEALIARMDECNMVLGELSDSPVWQVLLRDARNMIKQLDDHWQDMPLDSLQLKEARVVKMASKHISDLPAKYLQELNMLQEKIKEMQNPSEIIEKDADNG